MIIKRPNEYYKVGCLYRGSYGSASIICITKVDDKGFQFIYLEDPDEELFSFFLNETGFWVKIDEYSAS